MAHRVAGVLAHIEHQAVAALGHPLQVGYILGSGQHLGQDGAMLRADRGSIGDVLAGNDQHMRWCARVDVTKRISLRRRSQLLGWHLPRQDSTKKAVIHWLNPCLDPTAHSRLAPVPPDWLLA